jgi:hypothetical protein
VLVSGSPGSGKTTLSRRLGDALRLPVIHKDRVREGMWRSSREARDLGLAPVELFYATLEGWLGHGASALGDMTFERGVSEPDVARRLAPLADLVNVHCATPHAVARFEQRMRGDPRCGPHRLAALMPRVRDLHATLAVPLDFGCPTIMVDTTNGYEPSLESIVATIDGWFPSPDIHGADRSEPQGG